jgi:hypothetical protein
MDRVAVHVRQNPCVGVVRQDDRRRRAQRPVAVAEKDVRRVAIIGAGGDCIEISIPIEIGDCEIVEIGGIEHVILDTGRKCTVTLAGKDRELGIVFIGYRDEIEIAVVVEIAGCDADRIPRRVSGSVEERAVAGAEAYRDDVCSSRSRLRRPCGRHC